MDRYSARAQARRALTVGGAVTVGTVAALVGIFAVTRIADIPFTDLTRDAAATLDGPWYTGALSNLSIALVVVGAGIALFTSSLLPANGGRSVRGLLNGLAIVVLVMALDDLLLLHEEVFSELGLSEMLVFGVYGVALLGVIWTHREAVTTSTDYAYLALAGLTLGISLLVDVVVLEMRMLELPFSGALVEDQAKVLGLLFLAIYFIATSRRALANRMSGT